MCFEPFRDPRNERRPLCNVWLNMQPFTRSKRIQTSIFFLFVCIDGGQKRGGEINYASSSTASNHALSSPHSCECIGPLRDDYQSEHNPRKLSPKVTAAAFFEHATISTARVSLFVFFSCYAKAGPTRVCPLSPSGSHRFNDLSMLAWSTHCDEERIRVEELARSPLLAALRRLRNSLNVSSEVVEC